MTPTHDTPNRTPEEIIAEVLNPFPERVWLAHRIVARLRAAGLLMAAPTENARDPEKTDDPAQGLSGIPTEAQITAEAWARFPELDPDYASMTYPADAMRIHNRSAFVSGANWAALTAAAGVDPQEPSDGSVPDPTFDGLLAGLEQDRVLAGLIRAWDVSPEHLKALRGILESAERAAERLAGSAPSPNREKLIAEAREALRRCHFASGVDHATIHNALPALAAVPDETELAEVIWREQESRVRDGLVIHTPETARSTARVVREWWEKKR